MITCKKPEIGMGVSVQVGSDRYAATIIDISHGGKRIVMREDKYVRTDNNGMSESQSYEFESDPEGSLYYATARKDGTWRVTGSKMLVSLGKRQRYYDFSF